MKSFRMSLLLRRTAATAALLLVSTGAAQAATVFSQGSLDSNGGVRSVFWNADDFTLSSTSQLTGATFNLVQDLRNPNAFSSAINYGLYSDANGTPGGLLQSGTATATRTDTGIVYAGLSNLHFFNWAFDFASGVTALSNTRYWIGVQQNDDTVLGLLQNGANPNASAQIAGSVAGPYTARANGLAFSLQGSALTNPGAVPEPATWAMMIVGFGAIGGAMRRRTRTSVRFA